MPPTSRFATTVLASFDTIGTMRHLGSLPGSPRSANRPGRAPTPPSAEALGPCARRAKTTVFGHRRRPTHTSPGPARASVAVQPQSSPSAPGGGPRADRSSDASTLSVAGGRTTARSAITLPQVGHATPWTSKTRHNSTLHGVQREFLKPAFVSRSPTPRRRGRHRSQQTAQHGGAPDRRLRLAATPRRPHLTVLSVGEAAGAAHHNAVAQPARRG